MPTTSLLYFAYGSNMSTARLRARTPSARSIGVARLDGHALRFHKRGRDGSGKCDAFATGDAADRVIGVLYALDASELGLLDAAEAVNKGYTREPVTVVTGDGRRIEALTYLAMPGYIEEGLVPFGWYRAFVHAGAVEHHLPAEYISSAIEVADRPDPDGSRDRRERSVLGPATRAG